MQFGLSTRTKTENHSVQFTRSNLNKGFLTEPKETSTVCVQKMSILLADFILGKGVLHIPVTVSVYPPTDTFFGLPLISHGLKNDF